MIHYEYVLIRQQVDGVWYNREIEKRQANRSIAVFYLIVHMLYCGLSFPMGLPGLLIAIPAILFGVYFVVFHYCAAGSVHFCNSLRSCHAWHYLAMSLFWILIEGIGGLALILAGIANRNLFGGLLLAIVPLLFAILRIVYCVKLLRGDSLCAWLPEDASSAAPSSFCGQSPMAPPMNMMPQGSPQVYGTPPPPQQQQQQMYGSPQMMPHASPQMQYQAPHHPYQVPMQQQVPSTFKN